MVDVDLEQFASSGIFGPFDSNSTRPEIERVLGTPDTGGYPDFATYGHVSFDLAGADGPPCRIQIAFPHSSQMTPADPNWTEWNPPTCFNDWPDGRMQWNLGRFTPGLTVDSALKSLDDFNESELLSLTNGLRILHNSKSNVDLMFEYDSDHDDVTLGHMVAHPKTNAE